MLGRRPSRIRQPVRLNDTASNKAFVFTSPVRTVEVNVYVVHQNPKNAIEKNVLIISQGRISLNAL